MSDTIPTYTGQKFGWGIIGTGHIAANFAQDLRLLKRARLACVLSRDAGTADQFRERHGAEAGYGDMDHFLAHPGLDVVYVASPNMLHLPQALRAIRAGKAVLIEKPVTLSEPEVDVLSREAERHGVFAMEAMWMRFLPGIRLVKQLVDDGEIGEVQGIKASLGWRHAFDPKNRLFNKTLGGGASLDLGVYLLSLTMHLMGEPQRISGRWKAAASGVDSQAHYTLQYAGATADLACSLDAMLPNQFEITGSKGVIRIHDPFIQARRVEVATGGLPKALMRALPTGHGAKALARLPLPGKMTSRFDYAGHGLSFQAEAVMDALSTGRTSLQINPLSASAAVLRAIAMQLAASPAA